MNAKTYCLVSGIVFGGVAIAHLLRALQQWPIVIAGWDAPVGVSWLAVGVAGALAVWAFAARQRA